ncbi:hypothetical protein DPMN_013851 [Dreissena polymorpha]|uniref:Uncharacterized protein n=1 Tax=Dreissena polymorpha TaxID=45954 RepID=A0A9D4N4Y4_DREPO|nr:hypothetical protein DPMN_013851 [Dreissena polymorpha]
MKDSEIEDRHHHDESAQNKTAKKEVAYGNLVNSDSQSNDTPAIALQPMCQPNDTPSIAQQSSNDTQVIALQLVCQSNNTPEIALQPECQSNDTQAIARQLSNDTSAIALRLVCQSNDSPAIALKFVCQSNDSPAKALQPVSIVLQLRERYGSSIALKFVSRALHTSNATQVIALQLRYSQSKALQPVDSASARVLSATARVDRATARVSRFSSFRERYSSSMALEPRFSSCDSPKITGDGATARVSPKIPQR